MAALCASTAKVPMPLLCQNLPSSLGHVVVVLVVVGVSNVDVVVVIVIIVVVVIVVVL